MYYKGSKTVDGYPWIWNQYKEAGYVTQWVEDAPKIGGYYYRLNGFQHQPVHHYAR